MSTKKAKKVRKKALPCNEEKVKRIKKIAALAAIEHQQWAHWTSYMLDQIEEEMSERSEKLAKWFATLGCVKRWRNQCELDYPELSEREQQSDLKEVALKYPGYKAVVEGRLPDNLEEKYMTVADANRAIRAKHR